MQVGDKLIAATGVTLTNWQQLVTIIQNNPGKTFALEVERAGQMLTLEVTPARRQMPDGFDQGFLGMSPQVEQIPAEFITEHQLGPIDAMIAGMNKTWQIYSCDFINAEKVTVRGCVSQTSQWSNFHR